MRRALATVLVALSLVGAEAGALALRPELAQSVQELGSTDVATRRQAAARLGRLQPASHAVEALSAALERELEPTVRIELIRALGRHRDPDALGALERFRSPALLARAPRELSPVERELLHAQLGALSGIDDPRARELLGLALDGEAADRARTLVVEQGAAIVPELLVQLAQHGPSRARVQALGELGDAAAVPALRAAFHEASLAVKVAIATALGELGDEAALPELALALASDDPELAVAGAVALGRLDGPEAAVALRAALAHPLPEVAGEVTAALVRLGQPLADGVLEAALAGPRRMAVAAALAAVPRAEDVPQLIRLAGDPDTRLAALDALARVPGSDGAAALLSLDGPDVALALALAVRHGGVTGETRTAALARFASDPSTGSFGPAMAREAGALEETLRAGSPVERALAAQGLALSGRGASALREALGREPVPLVIEAMVQALVDLRADVPPLDPRLVEDAARREAALSWLAAAPPSPGPLAARAERRLLLTSLRAPRARERALAARALGIRRDAIAVPALVTRLDDPSPDVRRAVATALWQMPQPAAGEARAALGARLTVETDPSVRRALRATILSGAPACLTVQFEDPGHVPIDVLLPDGEWRRVMTHASGALVVCGPTTSWADVRPVEGSDLR